MLAFFQWALGAGFLRFAGTIVLLVVIAGAVELIVVPFANALLLALRRRDP